MANSDFRLVLHATYCYFLLQVLLVVVLIGTAIAKSVTFSEPLDYVVHITNWSWTLQIIFYILTLTAAAQPCVPFATVVVVVLLLPLTALVATVVIMVWILLGTDGNGFIVGIFTKIRPGFVMIGNDWFHLLPAGFLLLYYLVWGSLVYYALNWAFTRRLVRENDRCMFALVIYEIWGFLLIVAIYFGVLAALGTNVNEVYGTDLNIGAGIGVALLVALVVNGSILFLLARCYGVCVHRSAAQEALLRRRVTSSLYEDILEVEGEHIK